LIFAGRNAHLHFNDAGTFSIHAPFLSVLLWSTKGLLWFWGFAAAIALCVWKARRWSRLLWIAVAWNVIGFLPYCFLTYMPFVPSRHTYLASVGLALLVAAALIELHARTSIRHGRMAVAALAVVIVVHQCVYLWTFKHSQFQVRARATEQLVRVAAQTSGPIHVRCFPYDPAVAELALRIRRPHGAVPLLVFDSPGARHDGAFNFCIDPARERSPLSAGSSRGSALAP
jgi:hypothetical protein